MRAIAVSLLGALLLSGASAWAQISDLTLRQLNHRLFTANDGLPSDIAALAQTPDGTLWIGGRAGLTRFDGVRFAPYPGPSDEPLQSTYISSLLAAPDGGLWIGFRPSGVSLLKGGHVTRYGTREGLPDGSVQRLAFGRDGSVWAAARLGVARFNGRRWESVASEPQLGSPHGVLVDGAGTLWVATVDGLFARVAGEHDFRQIDARGYSDPSAAVLTIAPDGNVWAAADRELVRVENPSNPKAGGVSTYPGIYSPVLFDDSGNLWASELDTGGIVRVPSRELTGVRQQDLLAHAEKLPGTDESNPTRVRAVLQDRERNVWVATKTSLHRFSHSNVVRDVVPACSQDRTTGAAFAAGEAGTLWIACEHGSASYLDEIRDGAVLSRQLVPNFSVAYRDPEGTVWFAGWNGLTRLESGRPVTTPLPLPLQGRAVHALLRDETGAMWVSVARRGTFRFANGKWSENGTLDALPHKPAYVEVDDRQGALWFGYSGNQLARIRGRQVQLFNTQQGLEVGTVQAILAGAQEVWVGGDLGIARFDGARFVTMQSASGVPFKGISGIVAAHNGDLWLNGMGGIAHIARNEIERVRHDPAHRLECETFDYLDGVPGTAVPLRPQPSAVETTDGRIWFSMTGGVVSIDPRQLVRNTVPPPLTIWALSSGGKRYPNNGANLQLPIHTTDLQIDYSAGSLTVPERVHFRYKLQGSDRDWHDAGARREALYTNLGPGRYTFQVIAANNDGVWNNTGASINFRIAPAFYQTKWFYALCALLSVAMLVALYKVRMRQVATQVRERLEARLSERERIARELHDTLLQGLLSASMQLAVANNEIPPSEKAKPLVEKILKLLRQIISEGRNTLRGLRRCSEPQALEHAFAQVPHDLAADNSIEYRLVVEGTPRSLRPSIRDEVYRIGREALANAFRHSQGSVVETVLEYARNRFRIVVRDNGRGIDPELLHTGREGHWGLAGMRERTAKIGGRLKVRSALGAGTEVDLIISGSLAFQPSSRGGQ